MRCLTFLDCTSQPTLILFSLYHSIHPILISMLFHHYKALTECSKQVEQMSTKLEGFSIGSLWALVFVSQQSIDDPAHANSIRRYGVNHALMRRYTLD
jgi:hypothetical protein